MSLSEKKVTAVRGRVPRHEIDGANEAAFTSTVESVDWEAVVRNFAAQYDMTMAEVLRWISERTSLQVACEVFGIALSPSISSRYTSADVDLLNSLGDVLFARGHKVPRLMEHRRLEYSRKGREDMGFSLSREEYLRERATGKSKNKIAREQGISGPALFHWLAKWGLKDSGVEQREIELLDSRESGGHSSQSQSSSFSSDNGMESKTNPPVQKDERPESHAAKSNPLQDQGTAPYRSVHNGSYRPTLSTTSFASYAKHRLQVVPREFSSQADTGTQAASSRQSIASQSPIANPGLGERSSTLEPANHAGGGESTRTNQRFAVEFLVRLPSGACHVPETIRTSGLGRDEMMQTSLALLQRAIAEAHQDLSRLLGEDAATEQIQRYVAHQVEQYVGLGK